MSVIERILPRQADNRFEGLRPALWLLGLLIFVKLAMSLNSIFNTAEVAGGADGIPLESFGPAAARQVLLLFALLALGQLALTLVALTALVRYRALVPLVYLLLLSEQVARRLIARSYSAPGAAMTDVAFYVNYGLLTITALGLLSLIPRKPR